MRPYPIYAFYIKEDIMQVWVQVWVHKHLSLHVCVFICTYTHARARTNKHMQFLTVLYVVPISEEFQKVYHHVYSLSGIRLHASSTHHLLKVTVRTLGWFCVCLTEPLNCARKGWDSWKLLSTTKAIKQRIGK